MPSSRLAPAALAAIALLAATGTAVYADGNLQNVNHIIIVMQENHSFDNYFGALPYAAGTPYHGGPCASTDHTCVDGLSCTRTGGTYTCTNSNVDDDTSTVVAFHDPRYCTGPDLQHSWQGSHMEANHTDPAGALASSPMDGFVLVNDATEQIDSGESPTDDDTMGFYNETDLPLYYAIAQSFAINDRYFCSVVGPTFPNRSYEMAGTSFGHLTTNEIFPPIPGYKPITGTIFDLLDAGVITWKNYYSQFPYSGIFRVGSPQAVPISDFFSDAAAGMLPPVSFVDSTQVGAKENDEHPPTDIRAGEFFVWQIIDAVRNSPNWSDSVIFFTYDEHGGFYDHVGPPAAPQGGALNPDDINPGQCEDASNAPTTEQPGGGLRCSGHCSVTTSTNCLVDGDCPMGEMCTGATGSSASDAAAICPGFTLTGAYPANCANFNQLGIRVPFVAVSPFAKPGYVSHTTGDHTSMLAFIEKRFLKSSHLTARDQNANTLEDMFDFDTAPSMNTPVPTAPPPGSDPNCPTTTTTTLPPSKCTSGELMAAGKKAGGKAKCWAKATAKGAMVDGACLMGADTKFSGAYMKAQGKGDCINSTAAGTVETQVDNFISDLVRDIDGGTGTPPKSRCSSKEIAAAGKKAGGVLKCYAKAVGTGAALDPACTGAAMTKFGTAWGKATGAGDCTTTITRMATEDRVDIFAISVNSQLTGP